MEPLAEICRYCGGRNWVKCARIMAADAGLVDGLDFAGREGTVEDEHLVQTSQPSAVD